MEKPLSLELAESQVAPGQELHGKIAVNYSGRFDSLVINSQIENSSDVFAYVTLNSKKINHPYARLSIFRTELGGKNPIEFIAKTNHVPTSEFSNVKFRASIIQEHKEVASDIAYIRVAKA